MKKQYEIVSMKDHYRIRLGIFEPDQKAKAVVQLVHGFGEYTGHYLYLINELVNAGFVCLMHDQRGHGVLAAANPKLQGRARAYESLISDVLEVRKIIGKKYPKLPVYLFGHSMGGNISLNVLLRNIENQKLYQKAVIESPWLALTNPPAVPLQRLAGFLEKISPKIRVRTGLKVEAISHRNDLVDLVTKDGIYHELLSLRLFSQIMEAGRFAQSQAGNLKIPTLLFCGESDQICSPVAIRSFANNAGKNLELIEIADGYHALHLDTEAENFIERTKDFFLKENF